MDAVGVSSASSARNPCRPAACLHASLQSTYSRTAVHLELQLCQLRFISKVWLPSRASSESVKYKSDWALKWRVIKSLTPHCSNQSPLWCFIGVKISLIAIEAQSPTGYNATFDEAHLGRQHG